MHSMTVAGRFLVLLAASSILALGFGGWLLHRVSRFPGEVSTLTANLEATYGLSQELHRDILRVSSLVHHQLAAPGPRTDRELRRLDYAVGERVTRYLTLPIGAEERLAVERIRTGHGELSVQAAQIASLLRAGRRDEALGRLEAFHDVIDRMDQDFTLLNRIQAAKLHGAMDRLGESVRQGQYALAVFGGAMTVLLAAFLLELRRLVLDPVRKTLLTADRIRSGDLAARVPVLRDDELGRLATRFNDMADALAADQAQLEERVEQRTARLRSLQDELIQTAKLSALSRLVAGVSHEMNNPLTAILGHAELTRKALQNSGGGREAREAQEVIVEQVGRCRRIVSGLAQFAHPQRPRFEPVLVNTVVENVVAIREEELLTQDIRVERAYDPGDPVVAADPFKLEQVVLQLVLNARDSVVDAGRCGTIRVETAACDGRVELRVEDDGTGIEHPERVFEPFYTTKEVGRGTGLGLAVCYGIAEEHGGEIRAENLARGARVSLTLPKDDPEGVHPEEGASGTGAAPTRAGRPEPEEAG